MLVSAWLVRAVTLRLHYRPTAKQQTARRITRWMAGTARTALEVTRP
jgi:hypothetical protein